MSELLTVPAETLPPFGLHESVVAAVYHAWDACSASRLNKMNRSAMHCRFAIDNPEDDETSAKSLGTAGHACLLEPSSFAKLYAIGPDVKLNTKAGKDEWEAFAAANVGKFLVRGADGEKLRGMHSAVWSHPKARQLLTAQGPFELSALWQDSATETICKLRADHLCQLAGAKLVVDVKCVRNASPAAFSKAIAEFGYHRQAAFYLNGLAALNDSRDAFVFIVVENEAPHAVAVYALDDADIAVGAEEVVELLSDYATCKRTGIWPGYSDQVEPIRLPKWLRGEGV